MRAIVDNSCLAALASCETKAVLEFHLNLVPSKAKAEHAPREAGKAIHAGIAHFLRGGTVDEAMRVIKVMYRPFADREVPQDDPRMLWPNVEKCARSWFEGIGSALPFEPVPELIEVPFAVRVTDSLYLTGLIDGVVRDKVDGMYYVLENKSTGQKAEWWMRQWRLASQVSQYTYCAPRAKAVQEVLGNVLFAGVYINRIDMSRLPSDPKKKCQGMNGHGVVFAECGHLHAQHTIQRFNRTGDQLVHWLRTVSELVNKWNILRHDVPDIQAIQNAHQEGQFNGSCVFCDLQDYCATGRRQPLMLQEKHWGPVQESALEGQL